MRKCQLKVDAVIPDNLVKPVYAALAVLGVVLSQAFVARSDGWNFKRDDLAVLERGHVVYRPIKLVIVVDLALLISSLQPHGEVVRRIG